MSMVDSFNLSDYETEEELKSALDALQDEISTLNGFYRGVAEKLDALEAQTDERDTN